MLCSQKDQNPKLGFISKGLIQGKITLLILLIIWNNIIIQMTIDPLILSFFVFFLWLASGFVNHSKLCPLKLPQPSGGMIFVKAAGQLNKFWDS